MKKIGKILLVLLLGVVVTVGCGKKENVAKNQIENISLSEEGLGTVTFTYPQSLAFSLSEEKYIHNAETNEEKSIYTIYSPDYLLTMNMEMRLTGTDDIQRLVEENKNTEAFKKYNWGKYEGYSYGEKDELRFTIVLDKSDIGIATVIEGFTRSNDLNKTTIQLFNEKGIQDLFKSLKYKKVG